MEKLSTILSQRLEKLQIHHKQINVNAANPTFVWTISCGRLKHTDWRVDQNVREAAGWFGVWNFQLELRPAKIPPFQCVWTAANDSGNTSAVYIQDWSQLWFSNKQNHAGKKSKIFQRNELFKYGNRFPFAQEFDQRENCDDDDNEEQVFVAALVHTQWRVIWLNFTSTRNLQIFSLTTSSFRASPWIHGSEIITAKCHNVIQ